MKDGSEWSSYISDLLSTNGPEWTVERLKAYFTMSLHLRNNDVEMSKDVARKASIAYTKGGYPKHDLSRKMIKRFVESKKAASIKRAAVPLRVYTMITLPQNEPSKKQVLKAVKTIAQGAAAMLPNGLQIEKHVSNIHALYLPKARIDNAKIRRDMTLNSLRPFTSTYTPYSGKLLAGVPSFYKERPYFKAVASLMSATYIPKGVEDLLPSTEIAYAVSKQYDKEISETGNLILSRRDHELPGKIHIIQEGGCKPRTVAIPNAWVQMSFAPLHRILSDYTEEHFNDVSCVRDQLKGIHSVLRAMESNKPIHSIDLSAATDRFPLEPQLAVLDILGLGRYSEALKDIVSHEWNFPQGESFGYPRLMYKVGQPMGLYGSFPLFNLTHIVLAKTLQKKLEMDGSITDYFDDGTCFKIIGDDIVTSDDAFASAYKYALAELGVEVSPSKTFSGDVAEFAGFIAIRANTTRGVMAFKPYKFPKTNMLTNPINFLDAIGSRATKLSKKWVNRFEVYEGTRNQRRLDLSPIFDTDTEMCGITGQVTNQDVGYLRRNIQMLSKYGDIVWPSTLDWGVRTPPCVEAGHSDLVSNLRQSKLVPPPATKVLEATSSTGDKAKDQQIRRTMKYREEAKRFNQDPLVKEQIKTRREQLNEEVTVNPYTDAVSPRSQDQGDICSTSESHEGPERSGGDDKNHLTR